MTTLLAVSNWLRANLWLVYPLVLVATIVYEVWDFRRSRRRNRAEFEARSAALDAEAEWVQQALQKAWSLGHHVTDLHFPDDRIVRFNLKTAEIELLQEGSDPLFADLYKFRRKGEGAA
jgi:hypothetical protein